MELKVSYNDESLEFFQELNNIINQKYNDITITGYNENSKKQRKHAFGLKSNYGTKLTPFVVILNPEPVKAFYTDGSIPLTNLKSEKESLAIKASTVEKDTPIISGYRNSFYGSFNEKNFKLNSDNIRTLTPSNKTLTKGSTFAIPIPLGSQRIVIAYPASLGEINSICDRNGLGANIKSGFQISQINVEGANGYDAIPYYVYSIDRAEPNKTPNYYDVII